MQSVIFPFSPAVDRHSIKGKFVFPVSPFGGLFSFGLLSAWFQLRTVLVSSSRSLSPQPIAGIWQHGSFSFILSHSGHSTRLLFPVKVHVGRDSLPALCPSLQTTALCCSRSCFYQTSHLTTSFLGLTSSQCGIYVNKHDHKKVQERSDDAQQG